MTTLEQLHETLMTVFATIPLKIDGDEDAILILRKDKTQDDAKAIETVTREYLRLLLTDSPGLPEAVPDTDGQDGPQTFSAL